MRICRYEAGTSVSRQTLSPDPASYAEPLTTPAAFRVSAALIAVPMPGRAVAIGTKPVVGVPHGRSPDADRAAKGIVISQQTPPRPSGNMTRDWEICPRYGTQGYIP